MKNPQLMEILESDAANFACLFDVLTEHPDVQDNTKIYAAMCILKSQFIALWEKLEEVA